LRPSAQNFAATFFVMEVPVLVRVEKGDSGISTGGLDLRRILTFATDGRHFYAVYVARGIDELVELAGRIAPLPPVLAPTEAEVALPPRLYEVFAGRGPKSVKVPAGKIPRNLVSRESLRSVLVANAEPWVLVKPDAVELVAARSVKFLLCDEKGDLCVGRACAEYCRAGGRHYVRFAAPGSRTAWYEVPPELDHLIGEAELRVHKRCDLGGRSRETEPETLARAIAEELGISGEYVGEVFGARYQQGGEELLCGYVRRFRAFEVAKQGPLFGRFEVICLVDEGRELCYENESFYPCRKVGERCYAWRVGGLDASAPPGAVVRCILRGQCAPSLAETLPEPGRTLVLDELESRLRLYLQFKEPRAVRAFPLEVVRRVFGVTTYEEAEEKWRQIAEERRRRKEAEREEEERGLEEEKRRKAAELEEAMRGLPVKVYIGKYVYVRPTREVTEEEWRKIGEIARRYGLKYAWRWNAWVYRPG